MHAKRAARTRARARSITRHAPRRSAVDTAMESWHRACPGKPFPERRFGLHINWHVDRMHHRQARLSRCRPNSVHPCSSTFCPTTTFRRQPPFCRLLSPAPASISRCPGACDRCRTWWPACPERPASFARTRMGRNYSTVRVRASGARERAQQACSMRGSLRGCSAAAVIRDDAGTSRQGMPGSRA